MPGHSGIDHVGIPVADLERSLAFYRDVLGFELLMRAHGKGASLARAVEVEGAEVSFAFLRAGDGLVELLEYQHPRGRPHDRRNCDVGATHLAFAVDDVHAEYERLVALGVTFNAPPVAIAAGPMAGCAYAYFRDPDGIQLELFSRPIE